MTQKPETRVGRSKATPPSTASSAFSRPPRRSPRAAPLPPCDALQKTRV